CTSAQNVLTGRRTSRKNLRCFTCLLCPGLDLNSFRELNLENTLRPVVREVSMQDFTLLRVRSTNISLFIILGLLLLPVVVHAQGSGKQVTGTGGNHVIQGYVFFPSGRRAEGTII